MLKTHTLFCNSAIIATLIGCLLLTPDAAFAQAAPVAAQQQAVMKIEESTHKLTQENQETMQIIVSKVYDTQDPLGNSYLLRVSDGNKAVVIDPGYNYEAIVKYLGGLKVDVEAILLTNGNFIRIAGNEELRKKWPNAAILIGEQDVALLTDPTANMSSEFGGVTSPVANVWLKDGDTFEIAGMPISVIGTPGFSPGSMTYVLATDDCTIAFTGDFIYKDGISSGNMPSSREADLHKSLDIFLETQFAETLVFPGHGENTSLSEFYQKMTGNSISVLADDNSAPNAGNSPIIIVERDPATTILAQPVYVPTVEYRTETIYVERYDRPWVSVGVGIPLWSSWYLPWNDYYYHRPVPLPIYTYRPYSGLSLYFNWSNHSDPGWRNPYGGHHLPPLVVPQRPGRPVYPPDYLPPSRGNRPPGPPSGPPGIRPNIPPPRPGDDRPYRPVPGPGTRPNDRPPVPGIRPGDGSVRPTPPSPRPAPTTRPGGDRSTQPMPISPRPAPTTRPGGDRSTQPMPISPRPAPTMSLGGSRPAPTMSLGSSRPAPTMSPSGGRSTQAASPTMRSSTNAGASVRTPSVGRPAGRPIDDSQDSSTGGSSRRGR